jgi:hypothetical protein
MYGLCRKQPIGVYERVLGVWILLDLQLIIIHNARPFFSFFFSILGVVASPVQGQVDYFSSHNELNVKVNLLFIRIRMYTWDIIMGVQRGVQGRYTHKKSRVARGTRVFCTATQCGLGLINPRKRAASWVA